ncbi:hypothetical protein [Bdellovibrio sp. HCB2-146]|uniref:hypothetical protein n=1 Tax=Bdellovibrio sp. HCB2-146 TaxID=3394362 RepID=UPI0039BC8944
MSFAFYKTFHLASIFALFMSFGLIVLACTFATTVGRYKKFAFALHGTSWLLVFASAFGLVEMMGLGENFPAWAHAKTGIWFLLGASAFLIKFRPKWVLFHISLTWALGLAAIWFVVYKPVF